MLKRKNERGGRREAKTLTRHWHGARLGTYFSRKLDNLITSIEFVNGSLIAKAKKKLVFKF